jgi:hypothetical protein
MEYRKRSLNTAFDLEMGSMNIPASLGISHIYQSSIKEYNKDRYHGKFNVCDFLKRHFLNLICCCCRKTSDGRRKYYIILKENKLQSV